MFVLADTENHEQLITQRADIAANRDGYRDRDLIPYLFAGNRVINSMPDQHFEFSGDGLRQRFSLPTEDFTVALIGKDTVVKLSSTEPVGACELFAMIDGMPMRRSEIIRKRRAVPCHMHRRPKVGL